MKNTYANKPNTLQGFTSLYPYTKPSIKYSSKQQAFTIVELLIVIVVIAILATISTAAYSSIRDSARKAKITADLTQLEKAIIVARNNTGKTLYQITGSGWTAETCTQLDSETDLASLADSHNCKARYKLSLTSISDASGINVNSLLDPWGRPYYIDENEGQFAGNCNTDKLASFTYPFMKGATVLAGSQRSISLSGNSGCAA